MKSTSQLIAAVLLRVGVLVVILLLLFFLPAGTWNYWQAWVYLATILCAMTIIVLYLLKNDPALLERRMRMREREGEQRKIIGVSLIFYLMSYLLPGFDQRYQWSQMPAWVAILGDVFIVGGFLFVLLVFKTNTYTSRVVEVEAGQKVISSGPYAIVRHPMYVGVLVVYIATPLALGSYWAVLPGLMILPVLILRIINEEKLLLRDLDGYREYTQKVKYRLVPGLW